MKKRGTSSFLVHIQYREAGHTESIYTLKHLSNLLGSVVQNGATYITIHVADRPQSLPPQNRKQTGNRSRAY